MPTRTEQLIIDYIRSYQDEYHCTPNAGQIAYKLGWYGPKSGPANVRKYLTKMEEKGILTVGQPTRYISVLV